MRPSLRQGALLVAAAAAGGGAAIGIGAATTSDNVTVIHAASPLPAAQNVSQASDGISPAAIYRRDAPGVVVVTARTVRNVQDPLDPFGPSQRETSVAIGSGFVADAEGHIYTNAHVVLGASSVRVGFQGGSNYEAKVLGTDKPTDVAVLQVEHAPASVLHPLPLGSVSSVHVGDPVVAIGNPLNEQRTITAGIVSAKYREIESLEPGQQISNAIQTDAAINHGNSGGPLIDRSGRVIGITSQILTGNSDPNAGNIGIGFAIPINTVTDIGKQIIANGKAEHTYLGIEGTEITRPLQQAINLPSSTGVLISSVVPGSPAAKAGLQGGSTTATIGGQTLTLGGDIIVSIDGRKITSFSTLRNAIAARSAGDQVTLGILRDGKPMTVTVTLAAKPG
ncbi:MAG TPA: trypsin-like peptidase domain-containing protein [Gaiellales bacterium]|jgi:S1-C subfamily serine protease|nr:trypsin-like peptidase domain-containing protein [Gaiellales bacterium]